MFLIEQIYDTVILLSSALSVLQSGNFSCFMLLYSPVHTMRTIDDNARRARAHSLCAVLHVENTARLPGNVKRQCDRFDEVRLTLVGYNGKEEVRS